MTESYKLKQHTKFQAISYTVKFFAGKSVAIFEIMPTQDPWNSNYFESFQLLFKVNNPTEFGPSVYDTSFCLSVSHPKSYF